MCTECSENILNHIEAKVNIHLTGQKNVFTHVNITTSEKGCTLSIHVLVSFDFDLSHLICRELGLPCFPCITLKLTVLALRHLLQVITSSSWMLGINLGDNFINRSRVRA